MISNDKEIRVWALFKLYHPNFSGAAIQGHLVLSRLVRQGFLVTVLAASAQAAHSLRGKEIERDGITVCYLPVVQPKDWKFLVRAPLLQKLMIYFSSLASSLSLATKSAWMLWREGRHDDIVHLFSCDEFSFLPVWVARARGMHPVIQMALLGTDDPGSFEGGVRRVLGTLKFEAFRRAEAVVGLSSAMTNSCRSAGLDTDKVIQIPGGADLKLFYKLGKREQANLRQALGLRNDQRYLVFVGSAQYRKGIDVLIRAFIQVARQHGDVELLIVGPCDFTDLTRYKPTRQQLVNELKVELARAGCSARVHWVGAVDNVHEYLQAADIFCLPTRREGFGIVIVEAMATGLPVVAARLEGVTTDMIRSNDEGTLITGHDPNTYGDALLQLLKNPVRAGNMGNAARARSASEFNLEVIMERFARLYRELAGVPHA